MINILHLKWFQEYIENLEIDRINIIFSCILNTNKYTEEQYNYIHNFTSRRISLNNNVTTKIIEKYSDFSWDYSCLSCNPTLDIDFIINNCHFDWDWGIISVFLDIQSYLNII